MGALSGLDRLGERLRAEQDRCLSDGSAWEAARRELHRNPAAQGRGGVPPPVLCALAAVPVALGLGLGLRAVYSSEADLITASVGDVTYKPGDALLAPESAPLPVDFSDGSSVVLAPSARASVADPRPHGAEVTLDTGEARVHVVHRHHTNWLLNVGPFRVRVTGTRFAVNWNPVDEAFELSMAEGSVVVSGCNLGNRGRKVVANETLRARCHPTPALGQNDEHAHEVEGKTGAAVASALAATELAATEPATAVVAVSEPPVPRRESLSPRPASPHAVAPAEPEWLTLARSGEYTDAYAQLGPIFEDELGLRDSEELTLMADVARLSGHLDRAEHAYRTLRLRFANTSRAASAAFSLARLAFDQRQSYSEAARWFQVYLAEEPSGPFAREALGRRVEALHRAADTRTARSEAARYLQLYPSGPHARAMSGLLSGP